MEGPVLRAQRISELGRGRKRNTCFEDYWLWVSQKVAERKSMVQGKEESRKEWSSVHLANHWAGAGVGMGVWNLELKYPIRVSGDWAFTFPLIGHGMGMWPWERLF